MLLNTLHKRMATTARNDLAPVSVVPRMRKPRPGAENCLSAKVRCASPRWIGVRGQAKSEEGKGRHAQ